MAFRLRSDTNVVLENGSTAGNVLLNDSDVSHVTQVKTSSGSYVPVAAGGVTLQGLYGFLTLMPDGNYSYTATTPAAERMRKGATASDTFTYAAVGGSSSGNTTLKFTVTGVNDAPLLASTAAVLTTVTEDMTTNIGQTIASFLQSTDVDSSAVGGIAITGLASGNGQWQYSINGRTTWSAVGTVADTAALLLRSTDYVRFVPNGANGTTADFTFRAWDQTSGTAGSKVGVATNGGQTAFSTATGTASIVVSPVNDAPVGVASSAAGSEDGPPITGQVRATDVDSPTLSYTLVANSAVGGTVSIDPTTGNYSFSPASNFTGTGSFRFTASDGSLTSSPSTVTIAVAAVNDAPILPASAAVLTTITEDMTTNIGQTIASFVQSTDVDSSALRGIAITGLASGNGQWQYSINGRTTWSAVGTVADTAALLLRSTDYVRFVPNAANGTTADFTFRAWDRTSGAAGSTVDASINGGQTAFSTATGTASIAVSPVNDAPVGVASSAAGTEDSPPITGQVQATDVDSATLSYTLVANSAVGGTVSINQITGSYSFSPAPNFNGTGSFRFTASDGSLTSSPTTVTIAIAAVNDAPVANADSEITVKGTPVLLNVRANDSDIDGNPLTVISVGAAAHGTVQIENGQVRYSPNANFIGDDSFTYTISDGAGGTSQASAGVTVELSSQPIAYSVSFRQGANGYASAVDTMLKQNRASTSFGDAIVLLPGVESGKETQALLKFGDLFGSGPGQIPVGAQILSATLKVEATGGSTAGGTLNRMLVGWNGSSTWNSLGSGVQVNGVEATSTGAIAIGPVALGSRAFNVTDSLIAWNAAASTSAQQNAANLGWLFKPSGSDPWDFTSAQGAIQPTLSITYTLRNTTPALSTVSITAGAPSAENAGNIAFSVSLNQASARDVTVYFSTVDHTAKSGSDYLGATRSLTFLPGETTKSFNIGLINNAVGERLESFTVQIDSAINARIDGAVAIGRITDDDVGTAAMPAINATVVAVRDLSGFGIGDPSALAYIPGLNTLFVGDSEHDERPYYSSTNLFSLRLDGSFLGNNSLTSFTNEPTGLAYNPSNGYLYIADDDHQAVYWVSPDNPSVKLGSFDTARLGFLDSEDLKFDPLTGHIHILDGLLRQKIELTAEGVFVNSVPLPAVMTDAEALAYDPVHDLFFVASGASKLIWIMNPEGIIKGTINVFSSTSPSVKIKGLEWAPSSNPTDGDTMSLYVASYGADQVNDGKLFEVHVGNDWFT